MTPADDSSGYREADKAALGFLASEIAHFSHWDVPGIAGEDGDRSAFPDPRARLAELLEGLTKSPGQYALGSALLDRHLASMQEDFGHLMGQDELEAPYDRIENIVALFYGTLPDSYIGIDSHRPSRFWEVHPFLLDHLENSIAQAPVSPACHGRKVVRVLRNTLSELTKDQKRSGAGFRKYMRWHEENKVTLLRVDPGVAARKQRGFNPTIWTTDIGLWPRTGALLFEPRILQSERMKLQLYPRQDADRFGEAIAYVASVLEDAKELFLDGRKRLRERAMSDSLREDLMWSLQAIFEPGLADRWNDFVDSDARLENREGKAILDLLNKEMADKGLEKETIRVFDAAMGVGSESVFLLREGFRVRSNEVDWTLISHARRHAEAKGVELDFERHDWRHFEEKLGHGEYDAMLCLGNSLTCLLNPTEMVRALRGFHSLLRPGGLLLIDERNYRDMFSREDEMLGENFLFPGSVIYCGRAIKAKPLELLGTSDVAKLGYFEDGELVGTFLVYCYEEGEMVALLDEAGFDVEQTCNDFFPEPDEKAEFVTYAARRRD